jgi:hypothetical protein
MALPLIWLPTFGGGSVAPASTTGDGFKPALATYLAAQLAGVVGQVAPGRDFETDVYPAVIYDVTDRRYESLLAGPAATRSATVLIQAQSQRIATTDRIIGQLATLFHARTHYTMGSVEIIDSYADDDRDEYDTADDATDDGTYVDAVSITFNYRVNT